jgi:hypothetical protein
VNHLATELYLPNVSGVVSAFVAINPYGEQCVGFLFFFFNDCNKLFWVMLDDFSVYLAVNVGFGFFMTTFSAGKMRGG